MNVPGISDSVGNFAEQMPECPVCGTEARIGGNSCVSCLLRAGLDEAIEPDLEDLDDVLREIDVRDTDWRLGNYQILEEIGRGGMGVIYRARQRHSKRIVALKRVLSYHGDSRETLERFRREAEAAASLDHPNILPIYEVGESDGLPFFTMKYATGGSLQQAAPALSGEPRECVRLLAKITRAVAYAHREGILHRDLKPANILLDGRGEPMVTDFGLAKWIDANSDLARSLTIFGTPGYIAPEQARGNRAALTPAADVYSLGAILFDLLTGRPPFLGEHALAVIHEAAEKPAPKLRAILRHADRDLETICAKCLEREPGARYPSASDLAQDLERWLEGRPIVARPVSPPAKTWRWARRNPAGVGILALFVLAASFVASRELSRRKLESQARAEQLAARSIAVLPFLDLDNVKPNAVLADEFAAGLQQSLSASGPARVVPIDGRSLVNTAATSPTLQKISRQYSVRTTLGGTIRQNGAKLLISLHLKEVTRGTNLFDGVVETDSLDGAAPKVVAALTSKLDTVLQKDRPDLATTRDEDPALRNPSAREFLTAGKELADRRNGEDADRAIRCFERAIEAEPHSSVAYAHLALACLGRASFVFDPTLLNKAEVAATEAIRLGPGRTEAHRALAMVMEKKGEFERAQEEIYTAIDLDGLQERLASHLGAIAVRRGRPDQALRWSQIASQWQSRPAAYEHLMGDCLVELGLDEQAEAAYRRVVDLQPEMPEGWMGLCHLRLLQGDAAGARDLWRDNRKHYERFEFAKQMGAQVEFFTGAFEEARHLYEELALTEPDGGSHFYGAISYKSAIGEILWRMGDETAARAMLESRLAVLRAMLKAAPRNSQLLYETTAIESSLRRRDDALKDFAAAASAGWVDYRSALIDPRLEHIQTDPRFLETIEGLRRRVALLRAGDVLKASVEEPIRQKNR